VVAAAAARGYDLRRVGDDAVGVSLDETSTPDVVSNVIAAFGLDIDLTETGRNLINDMEAAAVEMLQVLSPTRNSSWNDILAQVFGAVVGAVTWTRTGAAVMLWLRHLATERESWAFTARLVQLYLPIYLLVQFTPFDSLRAAEIAAKYGEGRVTLVPSPSSESIFLVLQNFVGNALLLPPQ